jgi:hypothetical protein
MPMTPSVSGHAILEKIASLPMVSPCSLAPISAPQIQCGLDSNTECVSRAWSISR